MVVAAYVKSAVKRTKWEFFKIARMKNYFAKSFQTQPKLAMHMEWINRSHKTSGSLPMRLRETPSYAESLSERTDKADLRETTKYF